MTQRPRPTAPRTLAGTPSPQWRVPTTTAYASRFPALAAVLAGGAVIPACHDPACGTTRAEELEAHGRNVVPAARRGDVPDVLHEIGVALGLVEHRSTRVSAPGEAPVVTTTPQPPTVRPVPQVEPPMQVDGGVGEVSPVPPPPPQQPQPPAQNVRPQHPQPHTRPIPTRGRRMPVTPRPRQLEGDIISVTAHPPDLSRRS